MSEPKITQIHYICHFCFNDYLESEEDWPERAKTEWHLHGCKRCYISPRKGFKVRYNAWERGGSHLLTFDKLLKRGEIYTISKVNRWIHGTNVNLEGFGVQSFLFEIFTPVNFVRVEKKEE
jgi:hypothetical protein